MDDDYNTRALADIARDLAELMARSEERIERTNRMIATMADHEGWIEEKYIRHIDMLEAKLAECIAEKKRLFDLITDQRREYRHLLDKYEALARSKCQPSTAVTVA